MIKAIQLKVLESGKIQCWHVLKDSPYIINAKRFNFEWNNWAEFFQYNQINIFYQNIPIYVVDSKKML